MRASGNNCDLCGDPAVAVWGASRPLAVCQCCATETLPLLIADAIALPEKDARNVVALSLQKIKEVFLRGIKARQIRRKNGEKD